MSQIDRFGNIIQYVATVLHASRYSITARARHTPDLHHYAKHTIVMAAPMLTGRLNCEYVYRRLAVFVQEQVDSSVPLTNR